MRKRNKPNKMTVGQFPMIVFERKGRPAKLTARKLRMIRGSRYATRRSIAAVLEGRASRVNAGSDDANPQRHWAARATRTRIRIGCHVFSGAAFVAIRDWALSR